MLDVFGNETCAWDKQKPKEVIPLPAQRPV
jgi:hypothetical protein